MRRNFWKQVFNSVLGNAEGLAVQYSIVKKNFIDAYLLNFMHFDLNLSRRFIATFEEDSHRLYLRNNET